MKNKLKHSNSHFEFFFYKNNNLLDSKLSNSLLHFDNSINRFPKCKRSDSRLYLEKNNLMIPKSKRSTRAFNQLSNIKFLPDSNRSQSAIEFFILTGFVLFSFTVFLLLIEGNIYDKTRENQELVVKSVAITVQDEINLASQSSEGYYREFKIPKQINGREYDINITEGLVYIKTKDNKYAIALPVQNITGDIKKELNTIKKENGEVKLNVP